MSAASGERELYVISEPSITELESGIVIIISNEYLVGVVAVKRLRSTSDKGIVTMGSFTTLCSSCDLPNGQIYDRRGS